MAKKTKKGRATPSPPATAGKKTKMSDANGTNATANATASAQDANASVPSDAHSAGGPAPYTGRNHVERMALEKLMARKAWNVRSQAALMANDGPQEGKTGLGVFAKEDDAKEGVKKGEPVDGMLRLLYDQGQLTPVDAYPDPKRKGHFILADGFTRYEALTLLSKGNDQFPKGWTVPRGEHGMIDVLVWDDMTEEQAEDMNVIKNATGRDLKLADMAFGIARMGKRHSDTDIARMLGYEQPFVSKLHKIVKKAPSVARKWRETSIEIGYKAIVPIAELPSADEQEAAWNALLKSRTPETEEEKAAKANAWVDKSVSKAKDAGETLGYLDAQGLIDAHVLNFDSNLAEVAEAFGIKLKGSGTQSKEATKRQRARIVTAAQEAFDLTRVRITKELEAQHAAEKAAQEGVTPDTASPTAAN